MPSQQLPVVGNFLRDRAYGPTSQSIQDIYDIAEAMRVLKEGVKVDSERGVPLEQNARLKTAQSQPWWPRRGQIQVARSRFRALAPRINAIYDAPPTAMNPVQKRAALNKLYEEMVSISRQALGRTAVGQAPVAVSVR